jgi:chemotaxis protein methyltransferase CheR
MDIKSLERASPAVLSDKEPPFLDEDNGHALAQAIVDTIREPLLVLDQNLRVVTANRSFYLTFTMNRQDV